MRSANEGKGADLIWCELEFQPTSARTTIEMNSIEEGPAAAQRLSPSQETDGM
jgi:hypothetical protein